MPDKQDDILITPAEGLKQSHHHEVFSASRSRSLDSGLRNSLYRPDRLADRYVKEGNRVLDIGCGPGMFTRAFARKVGDEGLVIAVDIQEEMLRILEDRTGSEGLMSRIRPIKAAPDTIGLKEVGSIDIAFAIFVVHEVPDIRHLLEEVMMLLVPGGTLLIAEPRFIVSATEFKETLAIALSTGFQQIESPSIFFSRTALLRKRKS